MHNPNHWASKKAAEIVRDLQPVGPEHWTLARLITEALVTARTNALADAAKIAHDLDHYLVAAAIRLFATMEEEEAAAEAQKYLESL